VPNLSNRYLEGPSIEMIILSLTSTSSLELRMGGKVGATAAATGQRETHWWQLFSDPLQWWDCRSEKVNARDLDQA
jgi:hypothetical protein